MNETLSPVVQKYVDYGSENYLKALLEKHKTDKKLENINPYIGVLRYPSSAFLTANLSYGKTTQATGMHYVGHLEMLLPDLISPVNTGIAYTMLQFELDGAIRRYVQISNPTALAGTQTFKDYVLGLYPGINHPFPFNRNAWHILSDIEISGGLFTVSNNAFSGVASPGSFTPAIEFEFAISGYRCLMI